MRLAKPVHLLFAAATAATLVLTSCGSDSGSGSDAGGSGAGSGKPKAGGSLTYALDVEPTCFDLQVNQQGITGDIERGVVDSLVTVDAKGVFHPWLATSWEVASDLKTYTFKLREGVTFTDGTPFDAAAVKANFDRIVDKKTKSQYAATLLGPYTGTDVVDAHTVKVNFSKPFAPFLQGASTPNLGFYSTRSLSRGPDALCAGGSAIVGTGPFVFSSYTKGQSVVLTKNPKYNWAPQQAAHTGAAYLDKVTFRFLTEDTVRVGAVTSGQVDVATSIPPSDTKTVEADKGLQIRKVEDAGGAYNVYLNTAHGPLDDVRVRRAIQLGADVDQAVKTVYFGQYARAWSPLTPATPSYDKTLTNAIAFDPTAAGKLLDEAGWTGRDGQGYRTKDGKRLTVNWPWNPPHTREQREVVAQAIQADLKKIGVEVTRPALDIGAYVSLALNGNYDLYDFSWTRFEPDILRGFFNSASLPATGGQNAANLKDPQVDTWTEAGAATLDRAKRDDLYGKVQHRVVVDDAVVLPIYIPTKLVAIATDVSGLTVDPNGKPLLFDTWRS
ncbi:ABC-type dipeptide transport system, periplasmic component [Frankia torreyi]|uniref:ABC-type dipeptide transport system, periplasmic component n=1 Tax=Frankia torreyi TaxID=1856 RepID=A0A0D8B6R0_9ACTN|nr:MULTISPECIES: ABC transporter substrate-binding protein [Frankia]KJE19780.1 ABC-type dipeptide transport system, periplasmic component [Frankia torreyi]KQC35893.1 ABC transporter substrate-binding protein [Frankia sp. ACN1ag]KQM03911.1 ABC-type dipeptide transport system, periplasmic component [Frankia sp. CpI1-P]